MIALATSVDAALGVYALLLGSGVSTGSGVPTGWGVVIDLVRRAAAAAKPDDPRAAEQATADPERWWAANGDGRPFGYSGLLGQLATTPAARQRLLAGYFEPSQPTVRRAVGSPGAAHRAIAQPARTTTPTPGPPTVRSPPPSPRSPCSPNRPGCGSSRPVRRRRTRRHHPRPPRWRAPRRWLLGSRLRSVASV
jgi:hypothetical protein